MATEYVAELVRLQMLIAQRLERLCGRGTPVRRVSPGPSDGVTRVQWGDGTVLLGYSVRPGSLGRVAHAIRRATPVTIDSWVCDHEAFNLRLLIPQSRIQHIDVRIVGLDQPD